MIRFDRDAQRAPVAEERSADGRPAAPPEGERPLPIRAAKLSVETWLGKHFYATLAIGVTCGVVLGWFIKRQK